MKIKTVSLNEKALEERDYRDALSIYINDERVFSVSDGEPEDAVLGRDFSDCWGIVDLMHQAHQAGVKGEPIEIEEIEGTIEDL